MEKLNDKHVFKKKIILEMMDAESTLLTLKDASICNQKVCTVCRTDMVGKIYLKNPLLIQIRTLKIDCIASSNVPSVLIQPRNTRH